jgi:transposase
MHVLKIGCRWVDCPKAYGPHNKTIYSGKRRRKRFWVGHFIFSL